MIYIASPYSDDDPLVREKRFKDVERFCAIMLGEGAPVFSPIIYLHRMATEYKMPWDAVYWSNFNMSFLRMSRMVIVVKMEGWRQSHGVQQEISIAENLNIPIEYADFIQL